ncbi:cell division protein FtsA [Marinithermofilum abyssi]|uniref:Cell division protein FtsA n=1 Tax=Marinithermofilum abyssi TaxID=1571185 RepID=A0A8J2Y9H0_9BACL|nr:cell division protein FtsA [Marinithermofilum abyssi]GGE22490.1 cell division protein FtsA [Marinithermofilum abyssi]
MSSGEYIATLDIGTSKVRVIVAEMTEGSPQLVGVGSAVARGTKQGAIIDIDQAVHSIREAVDHAERMVGIEISRVFVGISGNHVSLQPSHGVVAVSNENREIGSPDIERVLQAARVVALPPERAIIEVVPKQFIVDGLSGIRDPHGMIGVRLEVEAIIVTGAKTIMHNVLRCVEKASLSVAGIVLSPLATSEVCLSEDEKNLGVVLADIGGGTTSLAIFQQGHMVATAELPIGGEYITNDIAIGLRTQTETAEKLKRKYGVAIVDQSSEDVRFQVPTIGSNRETTVNQFQLAHIIEPRVAEMFQLIRKEVEELGFSKEPAGGYVLTGGVMSIPHILDAAQEHLGHAVRIITPEYIGVQDPSFTSGVGMVHYIYKRRMIRLMEKENNQQSKSKVKKGGPSTFERMKSWFSEFI